MVSWKPNAESSSSQSTWSTIIAATAYTFNASDEAGDSCDGIAQVFTAQTS